MQQTPTTDKKIGLSIPVKVISFTGATYVIAWIAGQVLSRVGLLDVSASFLGIEIGTLYAFFTAVVVAAVATASSYVLFERPLAALMRSMSRAEKGDFLIRSPVMADDELGVLARSFNMFLSRITDIKANSIQSEQDQLMAQEQERLRRNVEEKSAIIERTNRTLELLVKDLSLIYEIGQEVNSIIDLDRLYATIAETLRKHLRISEFALLIFDERGEELHVKAAYGFHDPEAMMRMTFRKGEGITGLVAETRRKIYIKDTSRETRFLNYKGERPLEASSFLSVPLIYKDEVMGVVNFGRRGVGTFTYQDVKMLSLASNQVALAIANARLYTKTRELTVKDELTGINNRRHFQSMLQMEWKRAVRFHRPLSLIMMDVDHFKTYNDTFGHVEGDQVLRRIGGILRRNLREVDTVARFGGEEFVLLLPDTDKRGAIAVAEKVRMLIGAQRFLHDDGSDARQVTISAGIATHPDDLEEMDDLINHADIALYRAKELGRNRTECYQPLGKDEDGKMEEEFVLDEAEEKPEVLQ